MKYSFSINEEIARWVTEVYIRTRESHSWWIAFTNPVAGPWKKVTALNGEGVPVEIYRFEREGERPDLILVNDKLKLVLVVEAKDFYQKLIAPEQMKKSVRVIKEVAAILESRTNEHWGERSTYKIVPSFLWYTENEDDILAEDKAVKESFREFSENKEIDLINIVISRKNESDILENNFIRNGKKQKGLDLN